MPASLSTPELATTARSHRSNTVFPSETTIFRDPETGRRIRQLTAYRGHSHHLYFTNPGWWDHNRRLLFGSDRMGRTNLYSVELESGEIRQHTNDDMPLPPRETNFLFAAVNSHRDECYFWRGEKLQAVDLRTNQERALWRSPRGYLPNILNVSADGRYIYSVIYQDLSEKFPVDLLNGYVGFREYYEAHPHSQIIRVDVDSGRMDVVWEEHNWIGHVNTSPTQPHLLSFCHEGPWELVNRIWIFDLSQDKVWPLRRKTSPDEAIGHEYWLADGLTIGFHGHRSDVGGFFGQIRYDNTQLEEYPASGTPGHVFSHDSNRIIGDAGRHILLWGKRDGKLEAPRILCRHDSTSKIQKLHVHPRFSPDEKTVVFTSDRTGYGQVYEVEVGDWKELPTVLNASSR